MKIYKVSVAGEKWASDFVVQASGWPTAVARAIREWQKKNKGSKTEKLTIKAMKGGELLKENET